MAKIRFKYGTMNSSKSANLLMTRHNYLEQGKKVIIFKSAKDTRDESVVKSRALNDSAPVIDVMDSDLGKMFAIAKEEKPNCVLVDEVQFMPKELIDELCRIVDELDIPVISYGLMTDFQGNLFIGSKRLVEMGAIIEEVKTVCQYCSRRATHNMRLLNGKATITGEVVQVGGNESYTPVCRKCYTEAING